MDIRLEKQELLARIDKFHALMAKTTPNWDTAIIVNKVNQYYFTGTMQDGLLVLKRTGQVAYFARRSYERAKAESPLDWIYPMESYKDAISVVGEDCGNTYFELEVVPVNMLERIKKYFLTTSVNAMDRILLSLRAIKSPYELFYIEKSGAQHQQLMEEIIPTILKEGMTEADFLAETFAQMYKMDYHGISRFAMFQTEMVIGQIGFGDGSLTGSNFDGPGGALGLSAATPFGGSRTRRLQKGDLVFVDIGYGVNGYHSDKTQVYSFMAPPPEAAIAQHALCIEIQKELATQLVPGAIPADIYNNFYATHPSIPNFMGFGARQAKFLGHGVGLVIDEYPIITNSFPFAIAENMVISLEPKIGVAGLGMVGVEDTYVVTQKGGRCITGGGREIIVV